MNVTRVYFFAIWLLSISFLANSQAAGPQDNWSYTGTRIVAADGESFRAIASGPDGRLYTGLNDGSTWKIAVFGTDGAEQYRFGDFSYIYGIDLDSSGNIYVLDLGATNMVRVFANDGTPLREWGPYGTAPGEFLASSSPDSKSVTRLTVADDDTVLVTDSGNYRVQRFANDGTFIRSYGSQGSILGQFSSRPVASFVEKNGHVLVCHAGYYERLSYGNYYNTATITYTLFDNSGSAIRSEHFLNAPMDVYGPCNVEKTSDSLFQIICANQQYSSHLSSKDTLFSGATIGGSSLTALPNGDLWINTGDELQLYERHYRTTDNPPASNALPLPEVMSVAQVPATTQVEITYRVHDADDATVETRALAFVDGVKDLDHLLPMTAWEGDVTGLMGPGTATSTDLQVRWNAAADWSADFGSLKVAILARDTRDLIGFHWVTIPASGDDPELVVSKRPLTDEDLLHAWFWLLAGADPDIELVNGAVVGVAAPYTGLTLATGTETSALGRAFLSERLGIRPISGSEISRLNQGRFELESVTDESVVREAWELKNFVFGWGYNNSNQLNTPNQTVYAKAISTGYFHSLALFQDGTVFGWGYDGNGEATPPEGLNGVTAIAAGDHHSLALLSDGTVVGWGYDGNGEATPPEGLTGVTAIAAGDYHSLTLLSDGTVVGWGYNEYGQATPPEDLTNVTAIAAGAHHSLALLSDGTVVGWGYDGNGQATPPEGLTGVTAIAAGDYHSLALLSDGTVVGWGYNEYGQATPPEDLTGVTAIAAGYYHSLALLSDGTVVGWGYNEYGLATPPEGLKNISAIAAGYSHNLVIIEVRP